MGKLENEEHCGGEPEQADTGTVLYYRCNTSSQASSYMHIHSPFTGGFKGPFLIKRQMKRHAMYIYTIIMHNSARGRDKCLMHMPVVSPARAATVATHAWTKLHAQIMS